VRALATALAATLLAALAAPAADARPGASAGAGYEAHLVRTQILLDDLVATEGGPPGAAALVRRGGQTDFLRSGVADSRSGRAIHRTDHMRIASISKAFSGAVALSLVAGGAIGLDDTLAELLPGSPEAWSQVTLAELMQHTSGVPPFTSDAQFLDDLSADPRRRFTPEELIAYVADEPLEFAPGSAYRYSNTDNILIGLVAEQATGRLYTNDLRQLVYRPLGLGQTSLPSDWVMPRRYVHGYDVPDDAPPEDVSEALSVSGVWASGGIVSTPRDLNVFFRGYVGGELFAGEARSRQFDFVPGCGEPSGPGECSAGLSLYRYRTRCGTVFGHTGNFPGYTQFAAATRDGRRSVVVFANTQVSDEMKPDVFEILLEADEAAVCALFAGRR
jgi:D-alanyl-D-alanine carboxypeptidase